MVKRTPIVWFISGALLLTASAGCTGDDGPEGDSRSEAETAEAFLGSFVGEVAGTRAFVAVVAAPAQEGQDSGAVQVYVSDGQGLSEWLSGPISDDGFVAASENSDTEVEGTLSGGSVTGTVELPGGETSNYQASPPTGGAGLYELTVDSGGELSGASAAGLAVTGEIGLRKRGTGNVRLVDGTRLEFALTQKRAGDLAHLRAGQVRLIVLPGGDVRGAAMGRPSKGSRSSYYIRST